MQDYSDAAMPAIKRPIKEGLEANNRVTEVLFEAKRYQWLDAFRAFNKELQAIILPNREIHGVYFMDCFYDFDGTEVIDAMQCSSEVRLRGHCAVVDVVFIDAFLFHPLHMHLTMRATTGR